MSRLFKSIFLISFLLFFCSICALAEDITITTYYPSPYGVYKNLNIYNQDENTTQTDFTEAVTKAGLLITTDYTVNAYTPGLYWSTNNNNPTRPKAGIYLRETATGTNMYFGTSNDYGTGITNNAMVIDPSGNVGIGVTAPSAMLHVNGNIKAILTNFGGVANMRYNVGTNEIGYDIAELFETNQEVEPGDVLSIDDNGKLKKSSLAYDSKVAGVVSEAPAILFEGSQLQIAPQPFKFKKGNKPPLALAGRVKCKVVNQGGKIKTGDLLVTSSRPGYAMRGEPDKVHFGTVLGKALEPLNEKEGRILILVTL